MYFAAVMFADAWFYLLIFLDIKIVFTGVKLCCM
jgi:hypothetical protein